MSLKILGGIYRGRLLKSPRERTTRPTQGIVRQAVFNICQNEIEEASFLDLFAGSGAMGLEAISRGAREATFIEKDSYAARCIQENIKKLEVTDQTSVLHMDVLAALNKLTKPFTMIYIDPPYGFPLKEIVRTILKKELLSSWLFIEEREKEDTSFQESSLIPYDKKRYGIAVLSIYRTNLPPS